MRGQIEYDFDFSTKEVKLRDCCIGGLLHAVLHHCAIEVRLDPDVILKELRTTEKPFKYHHFIQMRLESRCFALRNVDLKLLSEKYRVYKEAKDYDLCIKSCHIRLSVEKAMSEKKESQGEPTLHADLAEAYLESGKVDKALQHANFGLKLCRTYHAERVKCYCILIRAEMMKNQVDKALEIFDETLRVIEFHLGPHHPLHSTLYSIVGHFYSQKRMFKDALFLYKSSLLCCTRSLGLNHAHTAEVYMDIGKIMFKIGQQEEALSNYEKGYLIFEASKGPDSIDCALSCYHMAEIHLKTGKTATTNSNDLTRCLI